MQQLSGLDATFLYLETAQTPMHVGALQVLALPAGFRGRFAAALRKHIASRLGLTPVLRRRLWWMPLNMANPAWVDAEPDLREHIVELRLPRVGGAGAGLPELQAEVARLHAQLLDRQRPLWKMHVLEGLAPGPGGERLVGLYTQLHHAAVDGQAAVALANALLDPTPLARPPAAGARRSRRPAVVQPEMTEMLRGALGHQARKVADIVRHLPATVGTLKNAATQAVASTALFGGGKGPARPANLTLAPRMPLNCSVGSARAFATASLPLAELRAMARAWDATLNDLVLMLCSTALRRFYARRHALPRKSLVAAVPVSLRAPGDATADNQASISLVNLGTQLADPRKRLAHVAAANQSMKSTMGRLKRILPTDFPSLGVPWLMEAATALYGKAKVAERVPQLANLVISNVPGPPVPLYLAGARLLHNYPASIVVHGLGLNITVQSYDQWLDFGLMADAQALPEVRELADDLLVAFDDLRLLLGGAEDEPGSASLLGLAGRATRGFTSAVTGAVSSVVAGTVDKVTRAAVGAAVDSALSRSRPKPRPQPAGDRAGQGAATPAPATPAPSKGRRR